MEIIQRQVAIARRRLMLQRFGVWLARCLFVLLVVAALAALLPKFSSLPVPGHLWTLGWAGGAVALAFLTASVITYVTRPTLGQVAAEVDHRFALRERLSSSLQLSGEDLDSEMGRALLADAERRAEKLAVGERFGLEPSRRALLPLLPAVFLMVLVFIPDATNSNRADANVDQQAQQEAEQVKNAATALKKRLAQRRREAAAEGLKEAEELFKELERQADAISKRSDLKKKEALVQLNDIKKQLRERRDQLGSPEEMRKALSGLKEMNEGPADKIADSLEKGDFGEAKEQVEKLAEKLRDGSLTEQEKQQLAEQMEQLQERIAQAQQQHEQAKRQLQEKIEQAKQRGEAGEAAKLQEKLNQLQQMDGQMQQLQEMAESMEAAQQAMEQGDQAGAAQQLQQMADQLGDMQQELEQLEDLQDALDQLSQAKDQMGCQACQGKGCAQCQGSGNSDGQQPGDGLGKGRGQGDRPEEENDTGFYDSQVRGQLKNGKAVLAGKAGGDNKKGVTRKSVQDAVLRAITEESDPMEDQVLPRKEREHAEQYFNRLREGDN
jgi:hypothetical protein